MMMQLGNTGKSVARSYARALDFLVARDAEVKTEDGAIRSPGTPGYVAAMKFLTTKRDDGKTPVDIYIEKQTAWTLAQDAWDKAKIAARRMTVHFLHNYG